MDAQFEPAVANEVSLMSAHLAHASLRAKLLPSVLSITAGSMDAIGFLGLGGLFTAHITGNLVLTAVDVVSGEPARLAPLLSVPIVMLVLALAGLLAGRLARRGIASLQPLLLVQFILLATVLLACVATGPQLDLNSPRAIAAGMLGVSAMAVQNALVQTSLAGAPSTAVMRTNVTRFMIDVAEMLVGCGNGNAASARRRARRTWPAIVGFAPGCGLGAATEPRFGLWSLALPTGLALLAFGMALTRRSQSRTAFTRIVGLNDASTGGSPYLLISDNAVSDYRKVHLINIKIK